MKTFIPGLLATTGLAVLAFNSAHAQVRAVAPPTATAAQETFSGDLCGNNANLVLKTPGADANPELKKFFGVWGKGKWDINMCNAIAVTEINGNVATVHYFYGIGDRTSTPGFFVKTDAVMKDKSLFFIRRGYPVTYDLTDGQLMGWYGATKLSDKLQKLK